MSDAVGIALVLLSVLLNGFFAGVETGFTSARRVRLVHWAREGRRGAGLAARLCERRESAIVGAVVGNNVAVVAGTGVATALAVRAWGSDGEALAALIMASVNIVFGEILPKTSYRARPESMIVASAGVFFVLSTLLAPLRIVAVQLSRGLLWLLGVRSTEVELGFTRERLAQHFALSRTTAGLDPDADRLLQSFIDHARRPVASVTTALAELTTVAQDACTRDVLQRVRETGHSRIPVVGSDGAVVGLILFRDLHAAMPEDPIAHHIRDVLRIPAAMGLDEAIGALTDRQVSLAVVESAAGEALGVVTLEDLLEPLVGDILDEHDAPGGATPWAGAGGELVA